MTTSQPILIIVCILVLAAIVATLFAKKLHAAIAMMLFPCVGAFVLGATPGQVATFALGGISSMVAQIAMIPLAVCFFYIITEAGFFNVIARWLIKHMKNKLWMVMIITALLAMFCGTGSAVMLTTTGIMVPVLRKMKVRAEAALCLLCAGQMFICMMPWQNAVLTISAVTGISADEMFSKLGPVILCGIVLVLILAVILAAVEKKNGAGLTDEEFAAMKEELANAPSDVKVSKPVLIIDAVLVVAVIVLLIGGWISSILVFLLGTVLAAIINFPSQAGQTQVLAKVSPIAFTIVITIFGLGTMMGVLNNTGMLKAVANALASIIPTGAVAFIPLILAVLGFWAAFFAGGTVVSTGLLPILSATYMAFGGNALTMACAAILSLTPLLMMGPFAVQGYTVAGFAKVDYNSHTKYSLKWQYLLVLITVVLMVAFGIIPLSL